MATAQENIARFQEIANRGLQDRLPEDKRVRFNEAVRRGIITLPNQSAPVEEAHVEMVEQEQGSKLLGALDAAGSVVSGVVAEPLAGLAGLGAALNPFDGVPIDQAGEHVARMRELLTYKPQTEEGQRILQSVGGVLEPVVKALEASEQYLGDKGYEAAGPVGGAIGTTIPTAALTLLGSGTARSALSKADDITKTAGANKLLAKAAPTVDRLKSEGRKIYKAIDDAGAKVDDIALTSLSDDIAKTMKKEGFNARMHPKVSAAIDEIGSQTQSALSVSEIDTLRKVAKSAASSIDPSEARLGSIMIGKIDDFLDNVPDGAIQAKEGANVGSLLKEARGYWGKARRAELIDDAIEKARNQASGFENGMRVQFRQILNNKKKMRGFSPDERKAIQTIVRGGKAENIARALGKFGFTEGQASSMLLSSLGVAGGAAVGGAPGAVAIPVIGQSMRKMAQTLTRKNVKLAREVVTAGKDGRKIANAYVRNVPKAKRSVEELTGLLLRGDVPLDVLQKSSNKLISDAAYFASSINAAKVPVDSLDSQDIDSKDNP